MSKIKAILFDMDGVLVEAKDWHYAALNKALALFGYAITRAEHVSVYDGLPTKVKLELLSKKQGLPKGLHAFVNEMKQQYTVEMIYSYCRPKFCHEYALARLKNEGYKIALCSNSVRETIALMMSKARLDKYFDLILSNQDVVQAKPDPEIYKVAMARLGVAPRECVIVEDNENGIRAAESAGGYVLKVDTPDDVTYDAIRSKVKMAQEGK